MNLNGRTLLYGFLAGALAVLVFEQGMLFILYLLKLTPAVPWTVVGRAPPLGLPPLVSAMALGGLWGIVYAALAHRIPMRALPARGIAFGLLGPLLLGSGLIAPLVRGSPMFWQWPPSRWLIPALLAAAFGLGVAVILNAMGRR